MTDSPWVPSCEQWTPDKAGLPTLMMKDGTSGRTQWDQGVVTMDCSQILRPLWQSWTNFSELSRTPCKPPPASIMYTKKIKMNAMQISRQKAEIARKIAGGIEVTEGEKAKTRSVVGLNPMDLGPIL